MLILILALWQVALHWYLAPLRIFKSTVYCHAISFVRVGAKQQHTSGSVKMLWLKWWFWWMGVLLSLSLSLLCHLVDYIPQLGKLMSTFNFNLGEYFENVEGNRLPRIFVSTVISRRGFWRWFQLNYFIPYCLPSTQCWKISKKCKLGSVALLSYNILKWRAILELSFFCAVLVAQGIHATGFKHA